jgi:hypothetical protein
MLLKNSHEAEGRESPAWTDAVKAGIALNFRANLV